MVQDELWSAWELGKLHGGTDPWQRGVSLRPSSASAEHRHPPKFPRQNQNLSIANSS